MSNGAGQQHSAAVRMECIWGCTEERFSGAITRRRRPPAHPSHLPAASQATTTATCVRPWPRIVHFPACFICSPFSSLFPSVFLTFRSCSNTVILFSHRYIYIYVHLNLWFFFFYNKRNLKIVLVRTVRKPLWSSGGTGQEVLKCPVS
jgi:hypothetical protein